MKILHYGMLFFLIMGCQVVQAASVSWEGWQFDYSTSDNSSGLVLKDVSYNNKQIVSKVSMPVMRVQYDNDVCGPYADILSSRALSVARTGAPNSACANKSVCERTFTLNGENMLEIGSNWQIGEYQIYQTYYFSEQGYVDSRVYSRGLQCQTNHSHHAHWMFDFDIDGRANDRFVLPDGSIPTVEFNALKADTEYLTIEDAVTGSAVRLTPSADDGVVGDFARWDFAARAYNSGEVERWRLGARGEIGAYYMNNENIDGADNVLWYVSHLPHLASEGAALWHASGPRLDANIQNEPVEPPVEPPPPPAPAGDNLLANGDFAQGKAGWFDCGAESDTVANAGAMRINNGGCLYQEVPVTVGEQYELACDISRNGNRWTVMELSYLDANYSSLNSSVGQVRTGSAVTQYKESAEAPAGTVYAVAVLYSEDDTGFDNCALRLGASTPPEPTPTPTPGVVNNLLSNGGFEDDLNSWNSCAATTLVNVTTDASDGLQSLAVNGGGCLYQEFPVEPGSSYKLDCKAKSGDQLYTSITLAMLDDQYASIVTEEVPVNATAYNTFSATALAPVNSQRGTVVIYSEDAGFFDDCVVVLN